EFLTDVRVPDSDRIGEVDQGWTVGTRWMFHEKNAVGGGSPYVTGGMFAAATAEADTRMIELARTMGHLDDPQTLELLGEAHILDQARRALSARIVEGMKAGVFSDSAAAIARLQSAKVTERHMNLAMDIAGTSAVATLPDDPWADQGFRYLE